MSRASHPSGEEQGDWPFERPWPIGADSVVDALPGTVVSCTCGCTRTYVMARDRHWIDVEQIEHGDPTRPRQAITQEYEVVAVVHQGCYDEHGQRRDPR